MMHGSRNVSNQDPPAVSQTASKPKPPPVPVAKQILPLALAAKPSLPSLPKVNPPLPPESGIKPPLPGPIPGYGYSSSNSGYTGMMHETRSVSSQDPPAVSQASDLTPTPTHSPAISKSVNSAASSPSQPTKQLQVSKSLASPQATSPTQQQTIQPEARISAAYLEAVFNENAYLDSLSPEVWLEMMPESKREMLREHPLLHQGTAAESRHSLNSTQQVLNESQQTQNLARQRSAKTWHTFLVELDTNIMPLPGMLSRTIFT